jgi:hypothetical protein
MLFPPQLGIKSHTKIFSCVGIWKFCAIDEDWSLSNLLVCEVNMHPFGFVEFYSPFSCPDSDFVATDCSFLVEISTASLVAKTAVSSANMAMVPFDVVSTSLI